MGDDFDDFDDIDEMDGMEGFGDAENEEPDDDRSAVSSTFKGASSSFIDDFKDTSALKQISVTADSAFQAAAGRKVSKNYNKLKNTLDKEINNSTRDIKNAAKPFVSKLKDVVPEEGLLRDILNKVDDIVGRERVSSEESPEAKAAREANELTATLFAEGAKKDVLSQALTSMATKKSDDILRQIAAINTTSLDFHNTNTLGYYRKSIELKYKHLFETKRMFNLQVKSFETFKRQFETIVKNTGLPEFVKIRGMEAAKAEIRNRAFGSAYESLVNNNSWIDNAKDNIHRRFRSTTEGVVDGLSAAGEGLNMATELGEQFEDADQRNMILGSMAADGTRTLSGRIAGKLFAKTKRGKKFRKWIEKINGDPGTYFGDMAENSTGIKKWAAGSAANLVSLNDDYTNYKDLKREDIDSATYFDNRTKKSINSVIPGLLSRIYASVEGIRTGNEPDGLSFDYDKDTFVSNSSIKSNIVSEIGNVTYKAHGQKIEGFVKTLVSGAGIELTDRELYKLSARLTAFGIRDKSLSLNTLEDKGFFKGLDVRTELIYRSIFDNIGKDSEGEIDWNVRDAINRELGAAVNIKSNPEKMIQKLIDDGNAEQLKELGVLKWDRVKASYIIDLEVFDKLSIKGINSYLYKEDKETLKTNDDVLKDKIKKATFKTKAKAIDKLASYTNKIIDPVMDELSKIEEAYDDPATKSKLRSARELISLAKEEVLKGTKSESETKKALNVTIKDVKNMFKGQYSAVKSGKKGFFKGIKDTGKSFYDKLKGSKVKSGLAKDASTGFKTAKDTYTNVNNKLDEDFDINISKFLSKGKENLINTAETFIIKKYLLDPEKDVETIKKIRGIIFDNIAILDIEDIKNLTPSSINDIYQNILDEIEEEGLHLEGVNTKNLKKDLEKAKKKGKDKFKEAKDSENSKAIQGFLDKNTPDFIKETYKENKKAYTETKKAYAENKKAKEEDKKAKEEDKEDKKSNKPKWVDTLTDTLGTIKDSIVLPKAPKFGIFDKDKDGNRDGGFMDRLNFFKRTKTKTKERKEKKKKKDSGVFSILKGALGIGGGIFATLLGGISKSLLGLPGALGNLGTVLSSVASFGKLGISTMGWGFSLLASLLRGGLFMGKGLGKLNKGLGKGDKWLGPKLRSIAKFPFKHPIATVVGGIGLNYAPDLIKGATSLWDDVFNDNDVNTDHPDIDPSGFAENYDNHTSIPSDTMNSSMLGLAAGATALYAGKKILGKNKDSKPKSKGKGTWSKIKMGAKFGGKAVPLLGGAIFAKEAYDRFEDGNYLGAVASTAGAGLSIAFPFVGSVAGEVLSQITEKDPEAGAAMSNTDTPKKPSIHAVHALLLDRIAKGEVGTTSPKMYNTSLDFGKHIPKGTKPLTSMTIAEVMEVQAKMKKSGARSSAVGRYQFIDITLRDITKATKMDIYKVRFTPAVQDALILYRLKSFRKYGEWLQGLINDIDFTYHLSREFASIACSRNTTYKGKPVKAGDSFYGQAVHTKLSAMFATLNNMRKLLGGKDSKTAVEESSKPKSKHSFLADGLIGSIKSLFKYLGIDFNPKAMAKTGEGTSSELDDGTPVFDTDNANPTTGGSVSEVKGNDIKGTFDIDKQLCGFPYKHVSMPNVAGPTIEPKYIVMHNTAGSSLYLGRMKAKGIGTAVWIDTNGDVIIVNKLNQRTWHVGPVTNLKGGSKQPVRSSNSIGIEVVCAYNKKTKKWNKYTAKQIESIRKVASCLMKKFNIPLTHVKAHFEVAFKTPGEGAEGVAVINNAGTIDLPSNSGDVPVDLESTVTVPNIPTPDKLPDYDDGTPVYKGVDETTKKKLLKRREERNKENDEYINNLPKIDMDKTLRDVDMSIGNKAMLKTMTAINANMEINNKYQEQIASNATKDTKLDITLKDTKGKTLPKNLVAPDKLEFDRAVLD